MNKKIYLLIGLLILILTGGFFITKKYSNDSQTNIALSVSPIPSESLPISNSSPVPLKTAQKLPNAYLIKNFPFESQAPLANWDQLHNEACEEASLTLVNYYLNNKPLNANIMEDQIQKMVAWEISNWGVHKDLTIDQTGDLAKGFYQMNNFQILNNVSIDEIKQQIAAGQPVIIPTAGRMLGNLNFKSPGPVYHMVVAIGYNTNSIIVQDVGTRNGDHYVYDQTIFYNAIHDWNQTPENIESGSKNILVFN